MKYLKTFESFTNNDILFVIDVQKSFSDYISKKYLNDLLSYCEKFNNVYQIWDNHVEGSDVGFDYLYDPIQDSPDNNDLYEFPNQKDLIEKRYRYDVDVDFFKKILSEDIYNDIKSKELNNVIKVGEYFKTLNDTILVYIGNNHKWFECPKKLYNILNKLKNNNIILVGGSYKECLMDIEITCKSLGLNVTLNKDHIYDANNSPIK